MTAQVLKESRVTTEDTLKSKLRELASYRRALEENQAWEETREEKLKALPEYQELEKIREEKAQMKDLINALRDEINELTLEIYQETGEEKPVNGVGIRVYKKLVYDPTDAFDYCMESLPAALKLDKRTFEKYVKGVQEVQPLDFVSTKENPRPTIDRDLGEYLEPSTG